MSAVVIAGDTSGSITLDAPAVAGTTTLTLPATNGTFILANASGNLQANSGYGSVATGYLCRAWVNFNGTGTVAIRASGNVTSITDNGTGDYTVNFTTAMPDTNYSVVGQAHSPSVTNHVFQAPTTSSANQAVSSVRCVTPLPNTGLLSDAAFVEVAIFR
jgi:hypothetical protein